MSELKIRRSTLEIVMLCLSFYEFTCVPHSLFLIIKYSIIAYLLLSHIKELSLIHISEPTRRSGCPHSAICMHYIYSDTRTSKCTKSTRGGVCLYATYFGNLCYHRCIYAMSRGGNTCKIAYKDIVGVCTCDRYSYGVY